MFAKEWMQADRNCRDNHFPVSCEVNKNSWSVLQNANQTEKCVLKSTTWETLRCPSRRVLLTRCIKKKKKYCVSLSCCNVMGCEGTCCHEGQLHCTTVSRDVDFLSYILVCLAFRDTSSAVIIVNLKICCRNDCHGFCNLYATAGKQIMNQTTTALVS